MTPKQLEAHRVRFEQQYAECHLTSVGMVNRYRYKTGNGYSVDHIDEKWQAYQWALADAGRAQRAAPRVQGSEPTYDMVTAYLDAQRAAVEQSDREFGRPNVGGMRICDVRNACFAGLKAALAAQPPQQSAQPVAWEDALMKEMGRKFSITVRDEESHLDKLVVDDTQLGVEFAISWLKKNLAATQPVEVQPLTEVEIDDAWELAGKTGLGAMQTRLRAKEFYKIICSIKPTSSERGA